jgi:23S rRNA (adenine2503-C2)-methyltransferase
VPPAPPNPLSLPSATFAAACKSLALPGGVAAALDRYARAFRTGHTADPLAPVHVAPVLRTHRSESPEGTVLKFTQDAGPAPSPGASGPAVPHLAAPVAPNAPTNSNHTTHHNSAPHAAFVPGAHGPAAPGASTPPTTHLHTQLPAHTDAPPRLEIESVLIPMIGKKRARSYTLCLSSQVGCAMGCGFCQTAQMGLIRSLTTAEIVGQWFAAQHQVERPDPAAPIRNIVFMGMGEPMDNLDAVLSAIEILTDTRGPALAMGRITISTVGRLDGIAKMAERVQTPGWHRLGLAVSLNAPNDAVRSALMPVNRAMPLAALREALLAWPFYSGVHHCLEYVLIPTVNDTPENADELAAFVLGDELDERAAGLGATAGRPVAPHVRRFPGPALRGLINLIPYNPRDNSPWPAPTEASVEAFMARLSALRVYVKRRRTKGRDTMAACGQLGNPSIRRTKLLVRGV